jgi:hypothetical protein
MQNYSKAAAGNYSFEIDRPSGIDPKETLEPAFRMATFLRKAESHFSEPVGTTNPMPTDLSLCPMFQYLMPLYKPHKTYLLLTQDVTISGREYSSQVELKK